MWVISALAITGHLVHLCIIIALLETLASMPSIDRRNCACAITPKVYRPFKCGQMVMFPSPMCDDDKYLCLDHFNGVFSSVYHYRMKEVDSKFDPGEESQLYAYWAGSVIGPFVHILAIVHVLLWGQRDSIVGSIVSSSTKYKIIIVKDLSFHLNYLTDSCYCHYVPVSCRFWHGVWWNNCEIR